MTTTSSVVVFHEETVKPSSPTPSHLRIFKLSLLDQLQPISHSPMLFLYPPPLGGGGSGGVSDEHEKDLKSKSHTLKKSLSQTLTRFYPFAGRLISEHEPVINCNDDGAHYFEARTSSSMAEVLRKPKLEEIRQFIPTGGMNMILSPLLLVQVTFFACGGLAIGLCLSHKVADGATIHTFASAWSRTAASSGGQHESLSFVHHHLTVAACRFPALFPFPLFGSRKKVEEHHNKTHKKPTKNVTRR